MSRTASVKRLLIINDDRDLGTLIGTTLQMVLDVECVVANDSMEAADMLMAGGISCAITDRLRPWRGSDEERERYEGCEGIRFVQEFLRPRWPHLPVVYWTTSFEFPAPPIDDRTHLVTHRDWKFACAEVETLLTEYVCLYEFALDRSVWDLIEPRLVTIQGRLLERLAGFDDVWRLTPGQFEEAVAEILERIGFTVLWIPGGKDQGIDIVASSRSTDYLIDVKRYRQDRPVSVEVVRRVYGVASAVQDGRAGRIVRGGIVTSSRFTHDAEVFRCSVRARPLLRDGEWLKRQLSRYRGFRAVPPDGN